MRRFFTLALALPLFVIGCAAPEGFEEDEERGGTESEIKGTVKKGEQFVTTARLNLREGPSTNEDILTMLSLGATVTVTNGTPQNGFYKVDTADGKGWVFGQYLKEGSTKVKEADTNEDGDTDEDNDGAGMAAGKTTTGQIETCKASYYASGHTTANGESYNPNGLTAAHKTLRFNTVVRVTNTANGKTVDVRINDRGPFIAGRCIDLSRGAFSKIAATSAGVASVKVEVLR